MKVSQELAITIKELAKKRKITLKELLSRCELSINTLSSMQSGGFYPRVESLVKIADCLDCSVDYLLGRTDDPDTSSKKLIVRSDFTEHENAVIIAYRAHPEMQPAIDRLLGINEAGSITIYTAANSDDNIHDEYTDFDDEEFTAMKNAPESEDVN